VTDETYREHVSLGYLFEHNKVDFDVEADYVGSPPGGGVYGDWPDTVPDLAVLADGYGVYLDEDGLVDDLGEQRITERFDLDDADVIARWHSEGTFLIGEFNMLLEPTQPAASERLQELFGIDAPGWVVHYFDDLAEVPLSVQRFGGFEEWPYEGPGIVFLSGLAGDVDPVPTLLVLTDDEHLMDAMPHITGMAPNRDIEETAEFIAWFEVVEAAPTTTVDAWFDIDVNEAGSALLTDHGIPTRWPAMVHTADTLYVAADGLDLEAFLPFATAVGGPRVVEMLPASREDVFFRKIYAPALQWAIDQAETPG
jgi:hypothetical protein